MLERLAKTSGKFLSQFAREMLLSAIKQDIKDSVLLSRLIQKIESLSEPYLQQQNQIQTEILKHLISNTVTLIERLIAFSNEFFFDRTKYEGFERTVREILKKFSQLH